MICSTFDGLKGQHTRIVALLLMMGIEGKIDPELILVLEHVAIQESLGRCFGDLILWLKCGAPIR